MSDHTTTVARERERPDSARNDARTPRIIGALPAGLELPARVNPPNPQHPEIPQTYDPRVSVQLERAARDGEAGMPGAAAREDLERFTPDPRRGAGPQPLPPRPRQTAEAGASGHAVEGIPPRETPVTFNQHFASYNAGETAAFTPEEAGRLADLGVTDDGGAPPAEGSAPANTTVPHATQTDDVLNCTMGEWDGEPTAYAYQWRIDGDDVGTDSASHTVTAADAGKSATCVVTATNDGGSAAAPPSNAVVVTA